MTVHDRVMEAERRTPQAYTIPSESLATVCADPQATSTILTLPKSPLTRIGLEDDSNPIRPALTMFSPVRPLPS